MRRVMGVVIDAVLVVAFGGCFVGFVGQGLVAESLIFSGLLMFHLYRLFQSACFDYDELAFAEDFHGGELAQSIEVIRENAMTPFQWNVTVFGQRVVVVVEPSVTVEGLAVEGQIDPHGIKALVDFAREGDEATFREYAGCLGVSADRLDALWAGTVARARGSATSEVVGA